MNFESLFVVDAFFWFVVPIAILEGVRSARSEVLLARHSYSQSVVFGAVEAVLLMAAASTTSPLVFVGLGVLRVLAARWRDGRGWWRGMVKLALVASSMLVLRFAAGIDSFANISAAAELVDPNFRAAILVLVSLACVVAILPVQLADEAKATLAAPFVLTAFARVGVPLGVAEPRVALLAPIVGAGLSLLCALWLLSAGMRANHFERSTLVSELVVCERGVLLSFVWLGLASGERLAGVGALLEWWAAAFALLSLEASLRVRTLPKPMAFFALAMAVGLPGTTGFVAEDLLAHGLLEMRPLLAAGFVCVSAINAAALYLALVNLIVDSNEREDSRPTPMMLIPAALSLLIGLVPSSFVDGATLARASVAPVEAVVEVAGEDATSWIDQDPLEDVVDAMEGEEADEDAVDAPPEALPPVAEPPADLVPADDVPARPSPTDS